MSCTVRPIEYFFLLEVGTPRCMYETLRTLHVLQCMLINACCIHENALFAMHDVSACSFLLFSSILTDWRCCFFFVSFLGAAQLVTLTLFFLSAHDGLTLPLCNGKSFPRSQCRLPPLAGLFLCES